LDRALLRPGRFDRQIIVGLPDVAGREQILKTHAKKVKLKDGVKLKDIARGTPGFSGADLANLINEAALMTASNDKDFITKNELELAKDKIMMGAERKSMIMPETEREMTAYHEAGHAIVGRLVPDHDPVYKVSIVPRGRALGVTMFLPKQDSYSVSRAKLEGQISSLFGGRIAEEIIYGEQGVSTGASNDIERATKIARDMVEKWGMSELGPISFEKVLGEDGVLRNVFSAKTQEKVDAQINKVINKAFDEAERILRENTDILESMTRLLIELETIDEDQIDMLMKREVLKEE
jgi:cell division protease FtsH